MDQTNPSPRVPAVVLDAAQFFQVDMDQSEADKTLIHSGTLAVELAGASEPLYLVVGLLSVPVVESTRCLQLSPEVFLLAHEGSSTLYCLITPASNAEGQETVEKFCDLLQQSSNFQRGTALNGPGDPHLFGLNAAKITESMATGTKVFCSDIRNTVGVWSRIMKNGFKAAAESHAIHPQNHFPTPVNPWFYYLLHVVNQKTEELKIGLTRATSDSFLWIESKLRSAIEGEDSELENNKHGFHKSESMRAIGAVAGQALENFMDVFDALDDAAGELCCAAAEGTTHYVRRRSGVEAAAATRQAFNAAGNVLVAATGHKMARRESVRQAEEASAAAPDLPHADQPLPALMCDVTPCLAQEVKPSVANLNSMLGIMDDSVSEGLRQAVAQDDLDFLLQGCRTAAVPA
eukprot:CAMPEP_0117659098 /NCGR_PEP_ID=MMETSP0804-20121206/6244_1 /TAXON_ID=1074897 /ORGANISM="Tetraselmis astigmatica, Strain CCMP880" /LENGTH=404 /DNA_ID=CAMNT_0005465719 /DNA_START=834 /DNA_END=2048 /DNA_ORIENTATION=+